MDYVQFIISLKVHISDCVNHDNKDNIELQRCTMYNIQYLTKDLFFVYRLEEDDAFERRWCYAFGLGVMSLLILD